MPNITFESVDLLNMVGSLTLMINYLTYIVIIHEAMLVSKRPAERHALCVLLYL